MQTGQHVQLVEAATGELLQMVRHAWVVRLSTKQCTIRLAHKVLSMKSQQVVHVIMIFVLQVAVGLSRTTCGSEPRWDDAGWQHSHESGALNAAHRRWVPGHDSWMARFYRVLP